MNGRVYDPGLGRFLSVDPVFQFPTNTQSLNPYTYVLNSPLSHTDPTGLTAKEVDSQSTGEDQDDNSSGGGGQGKSSDNGGANWTKARRSTSAMSIAGASSVASVTVNGQSIGVSEPPDSIGSLKNRDSENKTTACTNCREPTEQEAKRIIATAQQTEKVLLAFKGKIAARDPESLKGLRQQYGFHPSGDDEDFEALLGRLDYKAAMIVMDMRAIQAGSMKVYVSTDDNGGQWGAYDKLGAYEVGGRFLSTGTIGRRHIETLIHEGAHKPHGGIQMGHTEYMTGDRSRTLLNGMADVARLNPTTAQLMRQSLSENAYAFERAVIGR